MHFLFTVAWNAENMGQNDKSAAMKCLPATYKMLFVSGQDESYGKLHYIEIFHIHSSKLIRDVAVWQACTVNFKWLSK